MLLRPDGSPFAPSRAAYLDAVPGQLTRRDAKVYGRIAVGEPALTTLAMLDTGSTYSVLDADIAELIGAFDEAEPPVIDLATRHGLLRGSLVRRRVWLLAEEGDSLEVDATFWVAREWRYGHFPRIHRLLAAHSLRVGPAVESALLRSGRVERRWLEGAKSRRVAAPRT